MRRGLAATAGALALLLACVAATGPAAAAGATWSSPSHIEPSGTSGYVSVYGVSCPTAQVCVAVDEAGRALTWRSGAWISSQTVSAGSTLTAISCPSTRSCVATSYSGLGLTYNGKSWGTPQTVGAPATYALSCATRSFCGAVGATSYAGQPSIVATYNGVSWGSSATQPGNLQDRLLDISCPRAGRCTALNLNGQILTLSSGRWSQRRGAVAPGGTALACPQISFCMAVGITLKGPSVGTPWDSTWNGARWSAATLVPGMGRTAGLSISCPTSTQCTVVGLNGRSAQWGGSGWAPPTTVFPGGSLATVDVSCPTTTFCMAVNSQGQAADFGG